MINGKRGYAAIGLIRTKNAPNVGGALRAAGCFGASLVAIQGGRYRRSKEPADVQRIWRHVPLLDSVDDILSVKPYGAHAVAVEIVDGARPLPQFNHPERAYYIFGPEDGSIPADVIDRCDHVVSIPSNFCLNLAATVNVVLYDRMVKRGEYQQAC